jgi:pyruvoyl-dependent arginine decarboxylase (PvlArgDC)
MYGSSAAALPASCVVPAVLAADGTTEVRGAVTYYSTTDANAGGLAAETEDGYSKWTATLVHTTAETAENATTATLDGSYQRTKAGEVAWHTGNLRAKQWTEQMRRKE